MFFHKTGELSNNETLICFVEEQLRPMALALSISNVKPPIKHQASPCYFGRRGLNFRVFMEPC